MPWPSSNDIGAHPSVIYVRHAVEVAFVRAAVAMAAMSSAARMSWSAVSTALGRVNVLHATAPGTRNTTGEDATMDAANPPRAKYNPDMCFTCRGTGFCERCNGNGRYFYRGGHALVDCLLCAGSGSCSECDGTGRVLPQTEDD